MNSLIMKLIGIMAGGIVLVGGGMYLEQHHIGSIFFATASETAGKLFGSTTFSSSQPAFEVSLSEHAQKNDDVRPIEASSTSSNMDFFVPVPESAQEEKNNSYSEVLATTTKQSSAEISRQLPTPTSAEVLEDVRCNFSLTTHAPSSVRLNEIAWMGSTASASDEWIELFNNSSGNISLSGWQIVSSDAKFRIVFDKGDVVTAQHFYLLERTDDGAVPGVTADNIYAGALTNGGLWLKLFNEKCEVADEIDARAGFSAFGGDASVRKTLERNADGAGWHTSASVNGTPKQENSVPTTVITMTPTTTTPITPAPTPIPETTPTTTPPQISTAPNAIIVNELMAGADGKSDNEFIELYNLSDSAVSLTGWSMKKKSSTGSESSLVTASRFEGKSIPAHGYFLLGNETGYAGTPSVDVSWPHSYSLAYTNNAVALYNSAGTKMSELDWVEIPVGKSFGRKGDGSFAVLASPSPKTGNE